MMSPASTENTFSSPRALVMLATLCCLLWGSAYPAIKGGYALLAIARDDTAAQMVFAGVMVVNLWDGPGLDSDFTWLGEGFIVIAAFVLAAASLYGRRVSQQIDPMVMTGWQLGLLAYMALFLGETVLQWRNALALVLVCVGIWLVTTEAVRATR